jgi:hypothetical protein
LSSAGLNAEAIRIALDNATVRDAACFICIMIIDASLYYFFDYTSIERYFFATDIATEYLME